jgi:hypothetical protein
MFFDLRIAMSTVVKYEHDPYCSICGCKFSQTSGDVTLEPKKMIEFVVLHGSGGAQYHQTCLDRRLQWVQTQLSDLVLVSSRDYLSLQQSIVKDDEKHHFKSFMAAFDRHNETIKVTICGPKQFIIENNQGWKGWNDCLENYQPMQIKRADFYTTISFFTVKDKTAINERAANNLVHENYLVRCLFNDRVIAIMLLPKQSSDPKYILDGSFDVIENNKKVSTELLTLVKKDTAKTTLERQVGPKNKDHIGTYALVNLIDNRKTLIVNMQNVCHYALDEKLSNVVSLEGSMTNLKCTSPYYKQ